MISVVKQHAIVVGIRLLRVIEMVLDVDRLAKDLLEWIETATDGEFITILTKCGFKPTEESN